MSNFDYRHKTVQLDQITTTYHIVGWDSQYLHNTTIEIEDLSHQPMSQVNSLIESLIKKESLGKNDLIVTKTHPDNITYMNLLQTFGFTIIEQVVTVSFQLNQWNPDSFPQFLNQNFVLRQAKSADEAKILHIARTAFTQDRFHLDPKIPNKYADARYSGWVKNSLKSRTDDVFSLVSHESELVGFFIIAKTYDSANLRLAAIDPSKARKGLGKLLYFSMFNWLKSQGVVNVTAQISFQNIAVLNVYTFLVHPKFTNSLTVLHKHL